MTPPVVHGETTGDPQRMTGVLVKELATARGGDRISVIVRFNRPLDQVDWKGLEASAGESVEPVHRYAAIDGINLRLPAAAVRGLSRNPQVAVMEEDAVAHADLNGSTYWFGARQAQSGFGVTGKGGWRCHY